MLAIIDYGAGNLGSVYKAFKYIDADPRVTADPAVIARATHLVLPGVGAFGHCMRGLEGVRLIEATKDFIASGRPFLGICVGLQMLFDSSEEMGPTPGLGVLRGKVVRFRFGEETEDRRQKTDHIRIPSSVARPPSSVFRLKVPHIGWNALTVRPGARLFDGITDGERVYFVHSYYPKPGDEAVVSATTEYGSSFCCAVERGNVHATQFHPEKSGAAGLQILRNFASLTA